MFISFEYLVFLVKQFQQYTFHPKSIVTEGFHFAIVMNQIETYFFWFHFDFQTISVAIIIIISRILPSTKVI